jgi:para-nitrobenzyl esterase
MNKFLLFFYVAEPPVGNLRFHPPQPAKPWSGVKDVYEQPNICSQLKVEGSLYLGNEDCLYLHVYIPATASATNNLPVMFWIFGGGYRLGDGYEFGLYDMTKLAKEQNVIIVAANYRVGAFGFIAADGLAAEEGAFNSTGNYGVQDQRLALQWTQRNIGNFFGNKNKVTIFGESAGGFSVCWHIAHPLSKGLFTGAIMQSGSCSTNMFFRNKRDQVGFSSIYASHFGCDVKDADYIECLRSKSTKDILTAVPNDWPSVRGIFPEYLYGKLGDALNDIIAGPIPPLQPIMPWGPVVSCLLVAQ